MSDTIAVDVVGPSYWSYMATVMAECLGDFLKEAKVEPAEIPPAVYEGAQEFFALVLQAAGDVFPENPPASINAYVIASDALRGVSKPYPATTQDLRVHLQEYSNFINALSKPHLLTEPEQIRLAGSLKEFFSRLAQDGETEVYERAVQFEPIPAGYRLT